MPEESWDAVWDLWLSALLPWEQHWLTPRELDLHDRFVSGEVTLAEIEALIDAAHRPRSANSD